MTIRQATVADAPEISQLIQAVAQEFVMDDFLTEKAKAQFFDSTAATSIAEYIQGNYVYWVATANNTMLGTIAIKEHQHIFHLFIAPQHQGKGIASLLWDKAYRHAMQMGKPNTFTVFSSSSAQNIYKKWGFRPTKDFLIKNGIRSIPMQLKISS